MGNEGSVPQGGGEEFEKQAKAPPSAVNPPMPPSHAMPGQAPSQSATPYASKGSSSSSQPSPQQPQQQHSTRGGRMMNAVFHRRQNNAAAAPIEEYPQPGAPMMQAEDMVMMSQQQQQMYYQQQQETFQIPQYSQAVPPTGHPSGAVPAGPPNSVTPTAGASPATNKKGIGLRVTGGRAGAAIMNSMKNLNLGSGVLNRGGVPSKSKNTSKDWETKWDEDEDDSDGEEASSDFLPPHQQQPIPHDSTAPPMARPGMDVGLSSPPPATPGASTAAMAAMSHGAMAGPPRAHVITATPEQPSQTEDGVEWDTGLVATGPEFEKPNVQMFLPLLRVLGKGSFGKVVLVQKRSGKERGQLFAMKILRKTHLVRRRQIERTRTERKVLSVVNHPFIMKLHYAFQTSDKLYLVLDYCPGGELFFHLSRFRRFPERVARFYSAELLLALGHLHKRGIIYRDLKPENVLLDADGHVKLGDFGLAKAGIQHACEGATSMCGTPEYMAPEVLEQQGHGFCVDYWGLGMLVYEMMTGLPPWYTTDRTRLFRRLRSAPLDIPTYFSQSSASCVSALLERNPRRRLGVTGIRAAMEHEFFRSISWRALYGRRVEAPIRPCEGWNPPDATKDEQAPAQMNGNSHDLDAATANFDNTFTRMPVETEDNIGSANSSEDLEELHEDTFVGFTFDDNDRDEVAMMQQQQWQQKQSSSRQRTHNIPANPVQQSPQRQAQANDSTRHLD